jgi:hypothetical protein
MSIRVLIKRTAQTAGVTDLVLRKQPAQHLTGMFIDEVDVGEIPAGIADLEAGKMPVATGYLEAVTFDDDGAIAPALAATVGFGEGELESCTIRAWPHHIGAREKARNRRFAGLGVDLAIVVVFCPRLRRLCTAFRCMTSRPRSVSRVSVSSVILLLPPWVPGDEPPS